MQGLRDTSESPGVAVAKRQPKVVLNCTVEYSTLLRSLLIQSAELNRVQRGTLSPPRGLKAIVKVSAGPPHSI